MPSPALDEQRLQQAIDLAHGAIGLSDPNPRVGCVIGREDGSVLGTGCTQHAGGPHAEVMALRAAREAGHDLRGATAWVTLEPCAHHGRTPPCCDALIEAGLARVVAAGVDPFPQVSGAGLARLRAAGISVDMGAAPLAAAARRLNIGFFTRHERGTPWVRLKVAASLDGRTALDDGSSQWITGAEARADGHAWRRRAGAVLTGIGTALADDPRLDVRLVPTPLQPLRVVLDSTLRLPPTARLLAAPGRALVVCGGMNEPRADALRAAGAEVIACAGGDGRIDLPALLLELGRREVNELHIEAGATLNAAWLQAGLVDEVLAYIAPVLIGPGIGMAATPPLAALSLARRLRFIEARSVGSDLRVRLQPVGEGTSGKPVVENLDIFTLWSSTTSANH